MRTVYVDDADAEELKEARRDLETCIDHYGELWARQARAHEVRHNIWDGQSEDGRRHSQDGELVAPFEGASDARIPLVDKITNDKVALCKQSFFRAEVQVTPIEPGDVAQASSVSALLRWLRRVAMREELLTEVELAAQYMHGDDPGLAVVAIDWLQDTKLVRRPVTFEQLAAMYASGAPTPDEADPALLEPAMLADFVDVVTNREREREAMAWLAAAFPSMQPKARRRALRDLRRDGATDVPLPQIRENRPSVTTLRLGEDVFFPIGTADIQKARRIHRREWLNEEELHERVTTMGWNAEEVAEIIRKGRGHSLVDDVAANMLGPNRISLSGSGLTVNEHENLFEIWWSYERRTDEIGIAGIYLMVWNSACKDSYLWAGLSDYARGKYPFAVRPRERLGRQVTDSRGISRPLATHQQEIKVQRDARSNNTQLLASPPIKRKQLQGAGELILGPNSEVPVQRLEDFELITMPSLTQASMEMERTTREEALDYAAILVKDADPNRAMLLAQHDADNFNALWCGVFEQVLALCQQFYSPTELALITGGDDQPLGMGPDDIAGRWNIALEIDARDLNMDFVVKKLETYTKVLALDPQGVLDRSLAPTWGAAALFPGMANRLVQSSEKVTQRLIDEEQGNVAKMAIGMEPNMPLDGIDAPQTRLQAMRGTIANSPRLTALYQTDELFRSLLANREKFLQQQLAQEENKVVGRLGTAPLQGSPGMGSGPALPLPAPPPAPVKRIAFERDAGGRTAAAIVETR